MKHLPEVPPKQSIKAHAVACCMHVVIALMAALVDIGELDHFYNVEFKADISLFHEN